MTCVPDRRSGVKWFVLSLSGLRPAIVLVVAATFVALSGCDDDRVAGQVVAVVNGDEITVPELNAEARARGLIIGNDRALRDRVVQDLIDRKVLAQAAVSRELDRTPDYVLTKRRSEEMLLAGQLVEALRRQQRSPSDAEVAQFINSRPHAFDQRLLISVDRIKAPAVLQPDLARDLAAALSVDDAQLLLASRGVAAERRTEVWDSATFSEEMVEPLLAPNMKGVVLLQFQDQTIVARVVETISQPTPAQYRAQLARELLRSQQSQQNLQRVLEQVKSSARIRYNPRFAPR